MNERFKILRKSLGLTQVAFAEKVGLTRTGYSSVESGDAPVQERHIKLILSAFPQVSEEWLRTGAGEMFIKEDNPIKAAMRRYAFPDIVEKLLVAYDRLDPDEQEAVLKYTIDFVAEIAQAVPDVSAPPPFDQEEIDKEVESYRKQLIAQKMAESSRSDGTGAIDGTA